ncbi:hypothetical protein QE152_g9246 [Popillia japonica]|uniref:Uncharacterized protein n=1 Tax=Popillia japonica TaxID=7064 RepID=A0AAW1LZ88_POPJA
MKTNDVRYMNEISYMKTNDVRYMNEISYVNVRYAITKSYRIRGYKNSLKCKRVLPVKVSRLNPCVVFACDNRSDPVIHSQIRKRSWQNLIDGLQHFQSCLCPEIWLILRST